MPHELYYHYACVPYQCNLHIKYISPTNKLHFPQPHPIFCNTKVLGCSSRGGNERLCPDMEKSCSTNLSSGHVDSCWHGWNSRFCGFRDRMFFGGNKGEWSKKWSKRWSCSKVYRTRCMVSQVLKKYQTGSRSCSLVSYNFTTFIPYNSWKSLPARHR